MRSQLPGDIERLIGKTKGGGIQGVLSARRACRISLVQLTGLDPSTLYLNRLTRGVVAWMKRSAEQRVLMRCKTMFEGDAAAMSEVGVKILRELLLHEWNAEIFDWFLRETHAHYQTTEVYHLLKVAYAQVCPPFYETRRMVVKLSDPSALFSMTRTVNDQAIYGTR